jgi:hypothetical protein
MDEVGPGERGDDNDAAHDEGAVAAGGGRDR